MTTATKPSNAKKYFDSITALSNIYKVKVADFRKGRTASRNPFMIEIVSTTGLTSIEHKATASEALEYIEAKIALNVVKKWGA